MLFECENFIDLFSEYLTCNKYLSIKLQYLLHYSLNKSIQLSHSNTIYSPNLCPNNRLLALQVEFITTGITHHPASHHPTLPTVPVATNSSLHLSWFFFLYFLFFLFLERGFTFYLLLHGASSLSSNAILSLVVIFLLCFLDTLFLNPYST